MQDGFVLDSREHNKAYYGGNMLKYGISIDNENFIVKAYSECATELYSEYVASRFMCNMDILCQEAWLGFDENKNKVVMVKDFKRDGEMLKAYKDISQSSEDTDLSDKVYTYNDVDNERDWKIEPDYKAIQRYLDRFGGLVDIPGVNLDSGVNLDLGWKEYIIRGEDYIFVEQRTLPEGYRIKEHIYVLQTLGMVKYDLYEVMCRTHALCADNEIYVSRTPDQILDVRYIRKNRIGFEDYMEISDKRYSAKDYGWLKELIIYENPNK